MMVAGQRIATWRIDAGDERYPAGLRELEAAERPTLFGAGDPHGVEGLVTVPAVTIVGARQASSYGLRTAETLGAELATAGVVVVSGMARGVDAAAHRGALAVGGRTIAVLAGGPDTAYPASNRGLYARIVEHGTVVSEHPPGRTAERRHFAQRNRIMAALGVVTVIVEAAQPSGSLITADVALRLGRTVGAVPGQVGVRVAEGTNDLIRDGAHLIRHARDVLDLVFGVGVSDSPAGMPSRRGPPLDAGLAQLLELVRGGAATVDRLVAVSRADSRAVAVALTRLELLGYVRAGPLGDYAPTDLRDPE
jgi:DNA processing protein